MDKQEFQLLIQKILFSERTERARASIEVGIEREGLVYLDYVAC